MTSEKVTVISWTDKLETYAQFPISLMVEKVLSADHRHGCKGHVQFWDSLHREHLAAFFRCTCPWWHWKLNSLKYWLIRLGPKARAWALVRRVRDAA